MDDDLPTDFQVIVVGTGMIYFISKTATGMVAKLAYLSIFFSVVPSHQCWKYRFPDTTTAFLLRQSI